jgi:hypothetical protein
MAVAAASVASADSPDPLAVSCTGNNPQTLDSSNVAADGYAGQLQLLYSGGCFWVQGNVATSDPNAQTTVTMGRDNPAYNFQRVYAGTGQWRTPFIAWPNGSCVNITATSGSSNSNSTISDQYCSSSSSGPPAPGSPAPMPAPPPGLPAPIPMPQPPVVSNPSPDPAPTTSPKPHRSRCKTGYKRSSAGRCYRSASKRCKYRSYRKHHRYACRNYRHHL